MGITQGIPSSVSTESEETEKSSTRPKPCCACPETRKIRDECIIVKGEENCKHLIEAHKACMRSMGFNI